jgi:murein DD-endopeptidase MepM/ murein hydrolase activator NlpD
MGEMMMVRIKHRRGRRRGMMSMKFNMWLRVCSLLILLVSMIPVGQAGALAASAPPPVDMFQLPWDLGIAWYAIDGIDNGLRRPASSSHNYHLGGAIDFAPHLNMVTGENTSNFWVTAAAAGTVVATSTCYVTISHANGWVSQYQFLANIQVRLGDAVARNQRIGIIADGVRNPYCPGYQEINVPHLHFILRPSMIDASFAGWQVKYNSFFNSTTFTKNGTTLGLNRALLNTMDGVPTPTPATPPTQPTATPTNVTSSTPTPTHVMSPTPTLSGPFVSTTITPQSIAVGASALVTVRLNNVPAAGYTSAEFTCSYNVNLFEVSNITVANLFGADPVSAIHGPEPQRLIVAIAGSDGNKATTSGTAFTFNVTGLQVGQTVIECRARVSQGNNALTEIPFVVDYVTIQGNTPTPNLTPSATPTAVVPPSSPTSTGTVQPPPQTPLPTTTPGGNWLTFTNSRYEFMFGYPPGSNIVAGGTDNYTRINLIFLQGTNLVDKYMEVTVVENPAVCQSPLASSGVQLSETVVIAGITFLKQAGADGAAGNFYEWVAYSTLRNNVCVSLDFVLHSLNPGNYATPPPVYDYGSEAAVFGQIVSTYSWLPSSSTPAPTFTPITATTTSPAVTFTFTPATMATATPSPAFTPTSTANTNMSPTPIGTNGAIAGHVTVSKPVIINIYDPGMFLVATVESLDGNFRLEVAPGTYTIVAIAPGFLRAQAQDTVTSGNTHILPPIVLLAGDIDGNNIIDQFDALTLGMSYNATFPEAADLNNDHIINVLDLEALARNYRETGPTVWQ